MTTLEGLRENHLLDQGRVVEGHQNVGGELGQTEEANVHVHRVLGCFIEF